MKDIFQYQRDSSWETDPEIPPANAANPSHAAGGAIGVASDLSRPAVDAPVSGCPDIPRPSPRPCSGLEDIESFISEFLICSDDHRALLALWILHTYCYDRFRVSPYLEIRSAESESGKSTCLKVLKLLCQKSWLVTGVSPSLLVQKIVADRPTLLLDDWSSTFRASDQQKLVGFLVGGSHDGDCFAAVENSLEGRRIGNVSSFCPKAFAGPGALPAALSRRSLPIILQRPQPDASICPFSFKAWYRDVPPMIAWMEDWVKQHRAAIIRITLNQRPGGPFPGLSPAQQDCAEPFLVLAEQLAGPWPEKTLNALHNVFHRDVGHRQSNALLLLSDIRDAFADSRDHERIFTRDLLRYLIGLPDRPWRIWNSGKPLRPKNLAFLLSAFKDEFVIRSTTLRIGDQSRAKGFYHNQFLEIWEAKLPPAKKLSPMVISDKKPCGDVKSSIQTQVVTGHG